MAVQATEAIIFDCIGVLYKNNNSLFRGQELNTELVNFIKKSLKPHYRIGLLSNIDRKWIDNFISKNHLETLFDAVVVSGEEGIAKPSPEIYRRMSKKIGVGPDDCIMVDDLRENCRGAENAGMQSIYYTSNSIFIEAVTKSGYISKKH